MNPKNVITSDNSPLVKKLVNIAYIDATNLDKALKTRLLWKMDYLRFRIWLKEKYKVEVAYILSD